MRLRGRGGIVSDLILGGGGGGTRHLFLLTLFNSKNVGGGARATPGPLAPRSHFISVGREDPSNGTHNHSKRCSNGSSFVNIVYIELRGLSSKINDWLY